ncbi:MAG: CBS domain-containing protein [Actinobacteria bacterium]|nr:CBS domain-containing protein [Actinomycetota bacterium]
MLRELPVSELMTTEVLTFSPGDNVQDAMRALLRRDVDGAPVLDDGAVVGMLSTSDLIVEEARVHLPTVITLLGAYLELPSSKKRLDADMEKALGSTVGEVMTAGARTIAPDATVEEAATIMHEEAVDRIVVVDDSGTLVGIIARGDIVREIVREFDSVDGE